MEYVQHPPEVIRYAYQLVKEYERHQAIEDKKWRAKIDDGMEQAHWEEEIPPDIDL